MYISYIDRAVKLYPNPEWERNERRKMEAIRELRQRRKLWKQWADKAKPGAGNLRILRAMIARAANDGTVRASAKSLAGSCDVTRRTAERCILTLKRLGLIESCRRYSTKTGGNVSNVYRLMVPDVERYQPLAEREEANCRDKGYTVTTRKPVKQYSGCGQYAHGTGPYPTDILSEHYSYNNRHSHSGQPFAFACQGKIEALAVPQRLGLAFDPAGTGDPWHLQNPSSPNASLAGGSCSLDAHHDAAWRALQ